MAAFEHLEAVPLSPLPPSPEPRFYELPTASEVAGKHLQAYEAIYKEVDPKFRGIIKAPQAACYFKRSNLANADLGQIWRIADQHNRGYLDKQEFFVALKLIASMQNGIEPITSNLLDDIPAPIMVAQVDGLPIPSDGAQESETSVDIEETSKIEQLQIFNEQEYRAFIYFKENRASFQGNVWVPSIHLRFVNSLDENRVRSAIGLRDYFSLVFETFDDMQMLLTEMKNKGVRFAAGLVPAEEDLRDLNDPRGIGGLFDAPSGLKNYLMKLLSV